MAVNFYNTHQVANLQLPAVTVEGDSAEPIVDDEAIWQDDYATNNKVIISVRCHTAYVGGESDPTTATLLMDEVITTIKQNIDALSDRYRIMNYEVADIDAVFQESQSIGSEMKLELHKVIIYIQD